MIRKVLDKDTDSIVEIYNHYISETVATFEVETITSENMLERIAKVQSDNLPWLIAEDESSKGVGTKLYDALFSELKLKSVNSVIGGITLPNPASVALHEKFGMKQVAHFKEIGFKFNQWLDTGYWQVSLKA